MKRLNLKNLTLVSRSIQKPCYERQNIQPGIVHFGVGNFHRSHQAAYIDNLLCQGDTRWGIIGVSMRSGSIREALAPQDFLYTHITLGESVKLRIIGALLDILVAQDDPNTVISFIANSQIHLITTTITEKAYLLDADDIDFHHPDFIHDMKSLQSPKTIYGFIAAGIQQRYHLAPQPLSIICCDNLHKGGSILKTGVTGLLMKHCAKSYEWCEHNVSFCSSMVDRITPRTDDDLKLLVSSELNMTDECPVSTEPFSQWVIQDSFRGPRPPFNIVGATFTDNVTEYEQLKLRILNASHSITALLGYLNKDSMIDEAISHKFISDFVKQTVLREILPVTLIPKEIDVKEYIEQVFNRFQNKALPYSVSQVCTDSSQKIQQRWFPVIDDLLLNGKDASYFAFSLAAWLLYIKQEISNGSINDPKSKLIAEVSLERDDWHIRILMLSGAEKFKFIGHVNFMQKISRFYEDIQKSGIKESLNNFLITHGEHIYA